MGVVRECRSCGNDVRPHDLAGRPICDCCSAQYEESITELSCTLADSQYKAERLQLALDRRTRRLNEMFDEADRLRAERDYYCNDGNRERDALATHIESLEERLASMTLAAGTLSDVVSEDAGESDRWRAAAETLAQRLAEAGVAVNGGDVTATAQSLLEAHTK